MGQASNLLHTLLIVACSVIISVSIAGWTHRQPHSSNSALRRPAPPPVPEHAFFITTRDKEAAGWTSHARAEVAKIAAVAGIKHVTTIFGEFDESKWGPRLGKLDKVGLALAHYTIWERIVAERLPGAWVFEDDVVAHTNFSTLFPLYWNQVPGDYEVVWLGHLPVYFNSVACEKTFPSGRMVHEDLVWCTHAMVISAAGAERLATGMQGVIETSRLADRVPNKYDMHSDIFINFVGRWFLPRAERHKWVAFDATPDHLAAWGGYQWCQSTDFYTPSPRNNNGSCCESCHMPSVRASARTPVPLMGTGLIYQNLCKRDPWRLEGWRKDPAEAAAAMAARGPEPVAAAAAADDGDEYEDVDEDILEDDIDDASDMWDRERGEL